MDHTSKIVNISVNEEARKGSNPRRYTEKYRYKSTKVVYDIQVVGKKKRTHSTETNNSPHLHQETSKMASHFRIFGR